ncbi:hypothetical protein [Salinicoccus sp. Marseille-QA3877]
MIRRSKQTVNVVVDLSRIDKYGQIVVVKVNGEWIAIPASTSTTEKSILEEVKRHENM